MKNILEKLKGLKGVFETVANFCIKVFGTLISLIKTLIYNIRLKSRNIKEHIKNYKTKKEDVRLIEASDENNEKIL